MNGLERDTLFVALTRPQMFAGVTYSFFIANAVVASELFLIFRTLWALAAALVASGQSDEAVATSIGHRRGEGLVRLARPQ